MTDQLFLEIESCEYLYLHEIREPEDNALIVTLDEAIVSTDARTEVIAGKRFSDLRSIKLTDQSRRFELSWDYYAAYCVRDESYALTRCDDEDVASGRLVLVYHKSQFMEYILAKATWDFANLRGTPRHVQIICLNHVIDVLAFKLPSIRQI